MCKGKGEESTFVSSDISSQEEVLVVELCELCGSEASLYCQADDAFLCKKCDEIVHGANFLAQRHIRCLLCSYCRGFRQRYIVGNGLEVVLPSIVLSTGERRCNDGNCSRDEIKMP